MDSQKKTKLGVIKVIKELAKVVVEVAVTVLLEEVEVLAVVVTVHGSHMDASGRRVAMGNVRAALKIP